MFGNPVPGAILPRGTFGDHGERRPAGNTTFEVTFTFAEHEKAGRGLGTDIGNARCGAPVLAMAGGRVVERRIDAGNGARIIRIDHGGGLSSGYAHMASFEVDAGATVKRGDRIGVVGKSGADACHLHFDISRGTTRLDPWPMLDQNQETDMETTIVIYPAPRTWQTKGGSLTGRRLANAPLTKAMTFGAGSPAQADAELTITPTPAGWPAGPYLRVTTGGLAGFLVAFSEVDPGTAPQPVDCQPLIEAATKPLKAKITRLERQATSLERQATSLERQVAALRRQLTSLEEHR